MIKEFGIKRENEERRDGGCAIAYDPRTKKFAVAKQHEDGIYRMYSGGVDPGEDIEQGVLRELTEESGLYDFERVVKVAEALTHYRNTLRQVNRVAHATCFLVILKSANLKEVKLEEHEKFSLVWVTLDDMIENWTKHNQNHDYDHWLYFLEEASKLGVFIK